MPPFEFPVTNHVCPPIGQAFDLLAGLPLDYAGVDSPPDSMLISQKVELGGSKVSVVRDASSFTSALSGQLNMAGSGWGASVGMSLSYSSFSATNSSTISMNLDAFQSRTQVLLTPDAQLSADAASLLKSDPAGFALKYGDYFVAGYVYGKRCSAAYLMKFDSEAAKDSFSAQLSASYSGVTFSASMSAAIQSAQTSSHSRFESDTTCQFAGFEANTPSTLDQIATFEDLYEKAPISDSAPIKIIVMPWHYLRCVSDGKGLLQNDALDQLVDMVNKLGYIERTCENFVERSLYTGAQQLRAVKSVRAAAASQLEAITTFLREISKTNTQVTDQDLEKFPEVEPLMDQMNFALTHFVLAFKVKLSGADDDCNTFLQDITGASITRKGDIFDGKKGVYLTWSLEGNDDWEGTKGTTRNATAIARTIKNGRLTSNVLAVVDRETGTLQIWNSEVDQTLDQNDRSSTITIRGLSDGLACDDPANQSGISNFYGTSNQRTMWASVI